MLSVSHPKFSYLAACVVLALTGCTGRLIPPVGSQTNSLHLQGKVHGGQQPVNGATIQLYDITTAQIVVPSSATPLISSTVTSDANGGFTITGDYSCTTNGTSGSDQVYLVATGGDAGSGPNSDLVMMTALGNCDSLSASTYIFVNEVTTAATVFAYVDDYYQGVSEGANLLFLNDGNEYSNFLTLVDPTTGIALTTNGANAQLELNALANTISVCVNSSTDQTGHSAACDNLVALSDPGGQQIASNDPTQALWLMRAYPTYNTAGEYNYAPASAPFQPTLTAAPSSWDLGIVYGGCVKKGAPESPRSVHPRC